MFRFKKKRTPPVRTAKKLFHGVAIRAAEPGICGAVDALDNVRFLADDAPALPLPGCSNPGDCRCKYEHFEDRRTQPRRDSDVGLPAKDHPDDLRQGVGRRVTDG